MASALAGLMLAGAVGAQELPFDEPDDLVSALVVKARTPGPAWWRVSDADTTVWILGSPGKVPENVTWDEAPLKRRLAGANRLILPPREKASIAGTVGLLASLKKTLLDPRSPADRFPPALYKRLNDHWDDTELSIGIDGGGVDIRARKGMKAASGKTTSGLDDGEEHLKSIILALAATQLADQPLGKLVDQASLRAESLAAGLKVPRSRAGVYDELAAFKIGTALPEAAQQACLSGALDILDAQDANVAGKRARAQAWADGNVPVALGRSDRFDMAGACPTPPAVRAMGARNITAAVSAIKGELRRKGHAVAVIDLTDLLQVGGVLDQLRGLKGVAITAPDALTD